VQAGLWRIADELNSVDVRVRDLLASSKVIDPWLLDRGETSSDTLTRALDARARGKLLRPVFNFYVFKQVLEQHHLDRERCQVVTLGGQDERAMWSVWRRVEPHAFGSLYVPRLETPSGQNPWELEALQWGTDFAREELKQYLTVALALQAPNGDPEGFVEWLWNCGVRLWTWLDREREDAKVDLDNGGAIVDAQEAFEALRQRPRVAGKALADCIGHWFFGS
jgi:hypothetical protein